MEHNLKLMNNMPREIGSGGRGAEDWKEGERGRRRRSVMFLLPVNQTSIFSWREGRPSSNVNKAWEREGGRESISTLMFESIAQHDSQHEETRKGLVRFQIKIKSLIERSFC